MTKIVLISPPFGEEESAGKTESMKAVLNIIPPLGLCYIAAVLEKNGYDVSIIEGQLDMTYETVIKEAIRQKPDVVGMSILTPMLGMVKKIAQNIKKELPYTLVVVGGSHVTALPAQTLQAECFDAAIIGEGEYTFLDFVNDHEKNNSANLAQIKGLAFKKGGHVVINERREFIKNLDELPFPARHLLPPLSKYRPTPASYRKLPATHMMTSRGCPSLCTFCDRSIFGSTYTERSPENVVAEVEELVNKYKIKEIKFFDDTFTLNKKRLYSIFALMKERGINIPWTCLTKANRVDEEMLTAMKNAGCWQVLFGFESGNPQVLASLKKGTTIQDNQRAADLCRKAGLSMRIDYLCGTPMETMETMRQTLEFAKKINSEFEHFNKFTPLPGTELYHNLLKEGYKFDIEKYCSQLDHSEVIYAPSSVDKQEYAKFLDKSYKEYYLRPKYIAKQLANIRSIEDMK